MKIVSVNVGQPQVLMRMGRQYSTAINKRPVDSPVVLSATGLEGDRQADAHAHGGEHQAVCVFAMEHYDYFSSRLGVDGLPVPSFGENLTTEGLLETQVCIGDEFRIGAVVVQVSQPRQPCWKLALKHREQKLMRWVHETGYTGFYFRVLQAGSIHIDDRIELINRPAEGISVAATMGAMFSAAPDRGTLQRLIQEPALSPGWKRRLTKRLDALLDGKPLPAVTFDE